MKKKRIAAFLIMLCMVLNMLPPLHTYAEDVAASGTCGDSLTWTLAGGVLTISGTGAMYNYDNEVNPTPWYAQRETITEIEVAEGVESLGDFAFEGSVNLQAVSLPESLTQIGGWAFLGCTELQTIQIPDGVCEVGTQAFAWMYNLTDVYIGENLTTLGTETFQDCSAISITVAENNPTYSSDAGALYNKDKTVLLKAPGTQGDVFVVPATVTEIGASAFSKTLTAKKVILPEGLTTIWEYAFYGVLTLHEINVPSSVNYIGDFAFGASHQALTITFEGERPDSIHAEIFSDSVVTAYYPSDSTTWTESNRLSCGGTTTWICLDVSGTCGENLTWTLLNGVLTISGTGAMAEYDASTNPAPWLDEQYKLTITKVVIEEGVTTIAKDAFHGCTNLVSATIPDSVVSIGGFAFYYCASLQQICVSANVTEIGEKAFAFTTSLERIEVDENNTAYCSDSNGVLFDKDKLCLIQAPGKITGSYVIPASVTSIRDFAFMTCTQLSAVSIPSGVASIGALAFYNCSGLTNVIYCGTEEQWNAISVGALNTALTDAARQYHDWQEATCTAPKTCTVCGETEGEALSHTWVDGSCTVCGAASGTCGDSLTWTLAGGVLTISGTGAMYDYGTDLLGDYSYEDFAAPWYADRENIHTVIIEEGVSVIGEDAFYGCSSITSVIIPDTVTQICPDVFYGCSSLTAVTIPAGVTSISKAVFRGCSSLTAVTLPEGITTIGQYAFAGSGIQQITLPESLTSIDSFAFTNCTELERIDIPDSVSQLGFEVFSGCTGLQTVYLPQALTRIEMGMFYGCSALECVEFPGNLTRITDQAFVKCKNLQSIRLPGSLVSIGYGAFDMCDNLTQVIYCGTQEQWNAITISDYNTDLTEAALQYHDWADATCEQAKTCTICGETEGEVGSHTWVDGSCTVCGLAGGTCGDDATWTLEGGVLTISGTGAMYDYGTSNYSPWHAARSTITTVVIESGITRIGSYAFYDIDLLTSVTIPESVISIGAEAFKRCNGLTSIAIPNGVTSIGSFAFFDCTALTSITIADSVVNIESGAFSGCTALAAVTIPNGVTSIKNNTFYGCAGLTSITIPSSVTSIGAEAFMGCTGLTSVTIADSVTSIGSAAFMFCTSLTSITIPSSVTSLNSDAFYYCNNLSFVWVDEDNAYYCNDSVGAVYSKDMTQLVLVPAGIAGSYVILDGTEQIHAGALRTCAQLTSVEIPNSVTGIGDYAFCDCTGLTNVIIRDGLTSIGNSAFEGNDSLTKVIYCGTQEQWDAISISSDNDALTAAVRQYHSWADATCTAPKTCTICGTTEGEALGHTYEEGTCTVCGTTEPETVCSHVWADGVCTECGVTGGICGDNVTWTLEGGVLTISGTGEMEGYTAGEAPWYEIQEQIVSVVVEEGITKVGSYAFYGLTNLTAFELAASVTYLDLYAFANCTGLKDVVVPDTVETIYLGVFSGCSSLESMTLPFVGAQARGYDEYTQFPFGYIFGRDNYEGSTSVVQYYQGENQSFVLYTEYFVPSSLRTVVITGGNIHYGAFYGCKMLTSITLPETTSAIDSVAFCGCSALQTLTIPASVTAINANAFLNASGLHTVVFVGDAPAMAEEAFKGRTVTAYYPVGNETWTEEVMQNYGGSITWVVDCEHTWTEATCEQAKTCTICGATEGESLGHSWVDATCTAPKTCTTCGETEGEALGHTFENHICFCGMIDDEQALIAAIELSGDGKVTVFDAQILAEAKAGLRTLTDEQWALLGSLSPDEILNYVLGRYQTAE